ncbi:uncharacterized protein LOC143812763 [Ranitomeya variabilis]|uniref:uncharacterized protein LOC143812763 n=1 Tax=Ranitomeya variabilis TaxID=490064 RepID=UPI004057C828
MMEKYIEFMKEKIEEKNIFLDKIDQTLFEDLTEDMEILTQREGELMKELIEKNIVTIWDIKQLIQEKIEKEEKEVTLMEETFIPLSRILDLGADSGGWHVSNLYPHKYG